MKSTSVQTAIRYLLGLLMLWAAISKLNNPSDFLGSLFAYELPLPEFSLRFIAVVLPFVELICGVLLLANYWTETALITVAGLLMVFLLATGQAVLRDLEISCGCFDLKLLGIKLDTSTAKFLESAKFAFVRNVALAVMSFYLLRSAWPAPQEVEE